MAIRLASILIPIFMAFIGLGAVAVLEYQKHKLGAQAFGTEELGPMDYIRNRVAAYQKDRAVKAAVRDMNIADALPDAPQGWTRAEYQIAHGEAITGVTFEPSAIAKDTEKSIQDRFRFVQRKKRLGAAASYLNGDQIVALKIRKRDIPDGTSLEGALAIRMGAVADTFPPTARDWGTVSGTQYKLLPQKSRNFFNNQERPVTYRRVEGNFGALFDVFVFTNANDDAVKAVLEGVDYALLEDFVRATLMAQGVETPAAPEQAPSAEAPPSDVAALPAEVAANEAADEPADEPVTFFQRLGALLASNGGEEAEEEETQRMVCTTQKGYKHCFFPKEEE